MTQDDFLKSILGGNEYVNINQNNHEAARELYALLKAFMDEGFTREEAFELVLTIMTRG